MHAPPPPPLLQGPGSGITNTTSTVPGVVHARYDGVKDGSVPAVVRYGSLILFSPHPEAVEGVGISCASPLPPGCITTEDRLANWIYLAETINAALGTAWVIPTSAELPAGAMARLAPLNGTTMARGAAA